ncbi:hypothetical protein niasHT_000551 [Heterodera trifolii]|uniref:Uncharacterized protein n=1 Tax=Heterodera trifolii TaxID=157864 RepID=A0ABD2M482_9BILA
MSDNRKEAEEKMAKAIFISADCWLCVFELLTPSQLGFGISMISHRFDFYVDEHFKTRKWALGIIRILSQIGENGKKKLKIDKNDVKLMPIPQIRLPKWPGQRTQIDYYCNYRATPMKYSPTTN